MSEKRALVVIMNGVEEVEASAPIDLLRRAAVEVVVVSVEGSRRLTGRNGIHLEADCLFEEITGQDFDLIVIPGGPGHSTLKEHKELLAMLSRHASGNRLIGSICAGPVVLKEAGVLDGKRFTSFPGTSEVLPDREGDEPVVVDGNLITSQGAGTALIFGLTLVEALLGKKKRDEIAESICYFD